MGRQHQNLVDVEKGRGQEEREHFFQWAENYTSEKHVLYCEGVIDKDNGVIQWKLAGSIIECFHYKQVTNVWGDWCAYLDLNILKFL